MAGDLTDGIFESKGMSLVVGFVDDDAAGKVYGCAALVHDASGTGTGMDITPQLSVRPFYRL